ncbi:SDR family NAD(P)-dependent oxidoreductase [Dysgonomonas sp. ZJ709]|uniref:SDR family NAD(P)-dependent oxidoreductase n=1 Tax=Dysgonomonas sp. ZJ709 TaxID=2709797 RepID=UPI0013EA73EA|nr:glucose 1-dehydrogenase [Dysgonomonas sp. ZJ709]
MLKQKNAVITGGSDGIGLAIATLFAINGANVCLIARDEKRLKANEAELSAYGTQVCSIAADLSKISEIESVSNKILELFPQVDILVNNAGIGRFIPFGEMSEEDLNMHLDLNVKAPYMLTHMLFDSLKKAKGNVINISSYLAHRMLPGRNTTAYSMTKGAINSFTKALAFEVGVDGVRVNAIAPGSITTAQLQHNMNQLTAEKLEQFKTMIQTIYPMEKIGEPNDIAELAVFLASENAKWITGAIYAVDGGLTTN